MSISRESAVRAVSMIQERDGGRTLAEIAEQFGVSKQRVHQIVNANRPGVFKGHEGWNPAIPIEKRIEILRELIPPLDYHSRDTRKSQAWRRREAEARDDALRELEFFEGVLAAEAPPNSRHFSVTDFHIAKKLR